MEFQLSRETSRAEKWLDSCVCPSSEYILFQVQHLLVNHQRHFPIRQPWDTPFRDYINHQRRFVYFYSITLLLFM